MVGGLFGLLFMLAMTGISKLFPNKKVANDAVPSKGALRKFTTWNNISGWIVLVFIILCFYVLAARMPDFQRQAHNNDKSLYYAVLPGGFLWFLIGFVFMIGLTAVVYTIITRIYMWNDFDGFVKYSNQKAGMMLTKLFILFVALS